MPSVIWSNSEKYSRTTSDRRNTPAFLKKKFRGYVSCWLSGRSTKTKSAGGPMGGLKDLVEGDSPAFGEPAMKCPACRCRHAGGIRCYLTDAEDGLFLGSFLRCFPFGKTLNAVMMARKKAKEGTDFGNRAAAAAGGATEDDAAQQAAYERAMGIAAAAEE